MANFEIEETTSSKTTSDMIIEKIIPIIGALLLVSGLWYLIYTSVWVILWQEIKLFIWFVTSFLIIFLWLKFSEKLRYFWDVIIWIWILLLYWTLVYWSRSDLWQTAQIPEIMSLIVSFIFTSIVSYFANIRKSKVIIILSLIWAYLLPFVIWQNGSWQQSISFNSYLIYFAWINIVLFQMAKDFELKSITPLNIWWLFFWTTSLYNLSYSGIVSNSFWESNLLSWILFLILTIFCIFSLLVPNNNSENKNEWYLAIWYIWSVLWFFINISILSLWDIEKWILFLILSIISFVSWHLLWTTKTRYEHISLYATWVFALILSATNFIDLDKYSSIFICYISLIFAFLYYLDNSKKERLFSYYLFSFVWALYSVTPIIWDWENLKVILSLIPLLWAYIITRKDDSDTKDLAKVYSWFWIFLIAINILIMFIEVINFTFFIFYIVPLIWIWYIYLNSKLSIEVKISILNFMLWLFAFGHFYVILNLIWDIYPAPLNTHIFTNGWFFSSWMLLKWFLACVILGLWLNFYKNSWKVFEVLFINFFYILSVFLIWNHLIFAFINDLWVYSESGWPKALFSTLFWVWSAIFLIYKWIIDEKWLEKKLWLILILLTVIKIVFYDMSTMNMNSKIIVLMIVCWILLMFSYFVHKNWWIKSKTIIKDIPKIEEKNIIQSIPKIEEKSIVQNIPKIWEKTIEEKEVKENTNNHNRINELIKDIDVSDIDSIKFIFNNKKTIKIKSENLFKICKLIIKNMQKTTFAPKELETTYNQIIANYKSSLNQDDYKKLTWIIKEFVNVWGEVLVNLK